MLVNVAMSAILGVAIGGQAILMMETLGQLFSSLCLVCLIVLQAANMGAITNAISARSYVYVALAVAIFVIADIVFFAALAADPSALPAGSEGFAFPFAEHKSIWLLASLNVIWLVANVAAACFDLLTTPQAR
jgi:hypothetical protein